MKCTSRCFIAHPLGEYTNGEFGTIDCQNNATIEAEI